MARKVNRRLRELSEKPAERGARYIPGEEDDGPILSSLGFLLASVFIFVLVTAAAAWFGAQQIEGHLEASSEEQLTAAGFDGIAARADGRDVRLVGTVTAPEDFAVVEEVVGAVPGLRRLELGRVTLETLPPPDGNLPSDPFVLEWQDGSLVVSGTLSSESLLDQVVGRLEDVFPEGVDASGLVEKEGIKDEGEWLASVLEVVYTVGREAAEGQMLVNGDAGVITVSAELPTPQRRAELRQATEEVLALSPLDFVSGFTVEDAPPPPPRVEVEELQEELDVLIEGKVVEFALNSDRLTGRGERLLNEILEALRIWPDVPVEIAGHADAQGADDLNLELSQRRADAVLAYLVENGEDPERFQVIGYGETRPIADNATEEGRARNRRIEFVALID
jgi:OOP family OmpA-OmpF porin